MAGMLRWCSDQMRHLEEFHTTKIASKWPAPFQLSKLNLCVFLIVAAIAIAMNVRVLVEADHPPHEARVARQEDAEKGDKHSDCGAQDGRPPLGAGQLLMLFLHGVADRAENS